MRFALIATSIAAVVAVPFAMAATAPKMSSGQFLSAVQCAAYEGVTGSADVAEARYALNAEARRQSVETAVAARAEVSRIALQAVNTRTAADAAIVAQNQAAACQGAQLAAGTDVANAV